MSRCWAISNSLARCSWNPARAATGPVNRVKPPETRAVYAPCARIVRTSATRRQRDRLDIGSDQSDFSALKKLGESADWIIDEGGVRLLRGAGKT